MLRTCRAATDPRAPTLSGTGTLLSAAAAATPKSAQRQLPPHPAHLLPGEVQHPRVWRRLPAFGDRPLFSLPPRDPPPSAAERKRMAVAADAARAHYHPRAVGKPEWLATDALRDHPTFSHTASDATWLTADAARRDAALMRRHLAQVAEGEDGGEDAFTTADGAGADDGASAGVGSART